jgi:hypothetical protein
MAPAILAQGGLNAIIVMAQGYYILTEINQILRRIDDGTINFTTLLDSVGIFKLFWSSLLWGSVWCSLLGCVGIIHIYGV